MKRFLKNILVIIYGRVAQRYFFLLKSVQRQSNKCFELKMIVSIYRPFGTYQLSFIENFDRIQVSILRIKLPFSIIIPMNHLIRSVQSGCTCGLDFLIGIVIDNLSCVTFKLFLAKQDAIFIMVPSTDFVAFAVSAL